MPFQFNASPRTVRRKSLSRWARGLAFSLAAVSPLLSLGLVGCNRSTPAGDNAAASPRLSANTKYVKAGTGQEWDRALDAWWRGWQKSSHTKSQTPKPAVSPILPVVTIDIAAIASRHPAWKLAQALEENRVASLDFAAIRAAGISPVSLHAPSFDVRFQSQNGDGNRSGSNSNESTASLRVAGYEREAETVTAGGLESLQSEASDHQRDSLENFLQTVAARESDARDEYEKIRRTATETEIEATRNAPLPDIALPLLSPEEQLQVTNLRLQLLGNIFSSEEERARARTQLDTILAAWQTRLREHSKERAAALERARVEEPRRALEEGEAQLRRDLERLQGAQQVARETVRQEHLQRVRQDFGDEAVRLGVVLPAASLPAQSLAASTPSTGGRGQTGANINTLDFLETNFSAPSSHAALSRVGLPGPSVPVVDIAGSVSTLPIASAQRSTVIRALRSQAWHEAQKQAQLAARRFGWNWQPKTGNKASNNPTTDRTREVLQWLFG